jgi:hypothetical protein
MRNWLPVEPIHVTVSVSTAITGVKWSALGYDGDWQRLSRLPWRRSVSNPVSVEMLFVIKLDLNNHEYKSWTDRNGGVSEFWRQVDEISVFEPFSVNIVTLYTFVEQNWGQGGNTNPKTEDGATTIDPFPIAMQG